MERRVTYVADLGRRENTQDHQDPLCAEPSHKGPEGQQPRDVVKWSCTCRGLH